MSSKNTFLLGLFNLGLNLGVGSDFWLLNLFNDFWLIICGLGLFDIF